MKYIKNSDNQYVIKGETYKKLVGSRAEVFHNTAFKTSGGLTRKDLHQNKSERIVSLKKHKDSTKNNRLIKYGFGYKKGKFGYVKINKTRKNKKYNNYL